MLQRMTPVVKNLIIINVLVLIAVFVVGSTFNVNVNGYLAIYYWDSSLFNPFQIVTSFFTHSEHDILHILFNMYMLYFAGTIVEMVWGSKRFLLFYLICGLGAVLFGQIWDLVVVFLETNSLTPTLNNVIENLKVKSVYGIPSLGASGAISGVLIAFGVVNPRQHIQLIFPPIAMPAIILALMLFSASILFSFYSGDSRIDHVAHLGGFLTGTALLLYWRKL